jgi:hypothetical protein
MRENAIKFVNGTWKVSTIAQKSEMVHGSELEPF